MVVEIKAGFILGSWVLLSDVSGLLVMLFFLICLVVTWCVHFVTVYQLRSCDLCT